jgi:hypothetical protein
VVRELNCRVKSLFVMVIAISVCLALLVCFALFPEAFRKADLTPLIFLLGLVLFGVLCYSTGLSMMKPMTKGPVNMATIGASMLFLAAASGSDTFKVLRNMPPSAYRALAPAAICVGALLLLGLAILL